jgi:hypothetical protein
MPMNRNTLLVWAAVAWTIIIFILLVVPEGNLSRHGFLGLSHLDKAAHTLLFFLFVVIWYKALAVENGGKPSTALAMGLAQASFLYGTNMEFVQALFTSRAFEWLDILADGIGAYAGYLLVVKR